MSKARKLSATERRAQALELRVAGYSQQKIAEALGCSVATVARDLAKVFEGLTLENSASASQLRQIWHARLERQLQALWVPATHGKLGAVDRVLKIAERSAKLFGLDQPIRVAPTNPAGDQPYQPVFTDDEIATKIETIINAARKRQAQAITNRQGKTP